MSQHPIFYDDNPVKIATYDKLSEMVDRRSATAPYPIERVEVPFDDGKTISVSFIYCLIVAKPRVYLRAGDGSNQRSISQGY